MSRIQDILSKAERDGTARRTRPLAPTESGRTTDEYAGRPTVDAEMRGFVDTSPTPRSPSDGARSDRASQIDHASRIAPAVTEVPRLPRPIVADATVAMPEPHVRFTEPVQTDAEPTSQIAGVAATTANDPSPGAEFDPLLVAALAPASLAAEQYRSLRTRLRRAEAGRPLRSIVVTSPSKGDGKSLTASNLALTMAQEFQQRVLLVDADLRRPTIHRLFALVETPGLADVLMGMADLDQVLVTLPDHHLTILPAGVPPAHPAELLGSATMRRVLDTLRSRFDRILIDVPPVAPLADVHILAPMVDGLLMIVRAGVTPKPAIERALAGLDQSKILGLVLNEAGNEGEDGYYNYEGYGYVAG
jgi:protein-tyrosine kinase